MALAPEEEEEEEPARSWAGEQRRTAPKPSRTLGCPQPHNPEASQDWREQESALPTPRCHKRRLGSLPSPDPFKQPPATLLEMVEHGASTLCGPAV